MINFGLLLLTVLILIVTVIFHAGLLLDFIRPSVLQIQLLGVHLTLFGIIVVVAFESSSIYGFIIGFMGLITGMFGSFREPPTAKMGDKQ
ncbi:hypothetical protein QPK24_13465 [Paenibacillus polygoni]|uniref:Uncharacterized protein n=1 Tax=Paenibacillus polygoni TaxID=3050112 RepID=A0ABY8WWV0_9BACL|nr:hypothetical protein [Paenibacillus polygoni]WIV17436.1 hypothetical protein QPK24_13465 [Paenibacillus polygoni]